MYWPRTTWLRSADDCDLAAAEIRTALDRSPPTNAELCAVLRWMAGPEGRQEKDPSLRELIRAVFICRKEQRESGRGPGGADCALCHDGWATLWPDWREGWTAGDYQAAPDIGVPCLCAKGHARAATYAGRFGQDVRLVVGAEERTIPLRLAQEQAARQGRGMVAAMAEAGRGRE
jgi:hypothetical protein